MQDLFQKAIQKKLLQHGASAGTRLLLGVSGGADSMVLLHVMHRLKFNVTAAHVNFQLRGAESDLDAQLVRDWCAQHQIPFLLLETDTKQFAEDNKINTQLAAREIRYNWWTDLKATKDFDFILTAHHLDDNIETLFLNLLRGTGLKGLHGIPEVRDHFIRPMLNLSRSEIEAYAVANQVPFRDDQSNFRDDYQRNKLRHQLMPLLEELVPGFSSRMKHNIFRLGKEWEDYDDTYQSWIRKNIQHESSGFHIHHGTDHLSFLLRWLEEQGIPWNLSLDFLTADKSDTGKILRHEHHRLSRTNTGYFLENEPHEELITIPGEGTYTTSVGTLTLSSSSIPPLWPSGNNVVYMSATALQFPLMLRSIQVGDFFQPLGMQGKQKKLQDLMVDRKLDMHQKSKVRVLVNAGNIIWVIGLQIDERAKLTESDRSAYKLEWKES